MRHVDSAPPTAPLRGLLRMRRSWGANIQDPEGPPLGPLEIPMCLPKFFAVQRKEELKELLMASLFVAAGLLSLICVLASYWMTDEESLI